MTCGILCGFHKFPIGLTYRPLKHVKRFSSEYSTLSNNIAFAPASGKRFWDIQHSSISTVVFPVSLDSSQTRMRNLQQIGIFDEEGTLVFCHNCVLRVVECFKMFHDCVRHRNGTSNVLNHLKLIKCVKRWLPNLQMVLEFPKCWTSVVLRVGN